MRKSWKRIVVILLVFLIILVTNNNLNMIVKAVNGQSNNIVDLVRNNSISSKKTALEVEQMVIQGQQYEIKLNWYLAQIELASEEETKENLILSYEDYLVKKTISDYYLENKEAIINENNNDIAYELLLKYLYLPVYEAQEKYCRAQLDVINSEEMSTNVKKEVGYATQVEIETLVAERVTKEGELSVIENEVQLIKSKLKSKVGGISEESFSLKYPGDVRDSGSYQAEFLNKSDIRNFDKQITAYQNYSVNIGSQIVDSEVYVSGANNTANLLEIEKELYRINVEVGVAKNIADFNNALVQYKVKEKKIEALEGVKKQKEALSEMGQIRKLDLLKAEIEYQQLQYEKVLELYNMNIAYYGLELHASSCLQ